MKVNVRQMIYDSLIEIKRACMLASYVIMTYTFLLVVLNGRCVWTEPNNLILYAEALFLALSWIGFSLSSLKSLREMKGR